MTKLKTLVERGGEKFEKNAGAYEELLKEFRERQAESRAGGGEKAKKRHEDRGKMPVRDRVDRLLDPGTAFLELSPLAAHGMYDGGVPAAGIVTGIGRVTGREVIVVANDATVKGGTYYPMTVKKHLRELSGLGAPDGDPFEAGAWRLGGATRLGYGVADGEREVLASRTGRASSRWEMVADGETSVVGVLAPASPPDLRRRQACDGGLRARRGGARVSLP